MTVQPASGKETAVVLSTIKTKKHNKRSSLYQKSVMRKDFARWPRLSRTRRDLHRPLNKVPLKRDVLFPLQFTSHNHLSMGEEVGDKHYKPDLTKSALARLSVVYRSLQVAKSGVKKNRQAS